MVSIDEVTVFDFPWFLEIAQDLDVRSALRLRSTCRRAREACSDRRATSWRHGTVLPAALRARPLVRPGHRQPPRASAAEDIHLKWLFRNSPDVREVDLGSAPLPTDDLLRTIADECPELRSFSVRRGSDMLRLSFYRELRGLTSDGPLALLRACPRLERLCLSWCEYLHGDKVCKAIRSSRCRERLKYVNLDGVPRTTDAAIKSLSACADLCELYMRDTRAADLSPLAACSKLEVLHVCRGSYILPEGVIAACHGFKDSIRVLCCAGCRKINLAAAFGVLRMCSKLEVWNCTRGTEIQRRGNLAELQELIAAKEMAAEKGGRIIRTDDTSVCH